MATRASGADLDTIVPEGDEDSKVHGEGVRLMAEQLSPGPPGGRENPKKRGLGIDWALGEKQVPQQLSSLLELSPRSTLRVYSFTFHVSFLPSGRAERIERQRIREEDIGILKNWKAQK